jgi:hypothetical protein
MIEEFINKQKEPKLDDEYYVANRLAILQALKIGFENAK